MNVHLDSAVHDKLKTLGHVAAGELVVVVDGDGDSAAGLLFNILLEEVRADAVVRGVGLTVAGHVDAELLVLTVAGLGAAGSGGAAAGAQGEDHAQCKTECEDFFHFRFSFIPLFFIF